MTETSATNMMPSYRSHKVVQAAKIVSVEADEGRLHVAVEGRGPGGFSLGTTWMERHRPVVGGYLVRYPNDDYYSFSPAKAFEDGYTMLDATGRGQARAGLLTALATMPDEAFMWLVLACRQRAMVNGANNQVWPDGIGGFTSESRSAIDGVRGAAEAWIEATP